MSRTEASALYQGGVLNAKNMLAASEDSLATTLRTNVPFRSRPGDGKGTLCDVHELDHRGCNA